MAAAPEPIDDRRASLLAGALIAAVVVVLGFGSGLWSELAERASGSAAASPGRDLGTVVQDAGQIAVSTTIAAPASSTFPSTVAHHAGATTAPTAPVVASSTTAGPTTTTIARCSMGTVAPFWAHFAAAHLETSPGQQVADALDVDQYVLAHTVLVRNMLSPILEALLGTSGEPGPFWRHLSRAHLETSPGQQIADALALDRYVQTHTVLVEDIAAPIVGTC